MILWIYLRYGDFAYLSGFGDFIYGCMLILWHVYFGDVWFTTAATDEKFYKCMLHDICWRRSVYFLKKCFIRMLYRFNRSRVLHWQFPTYLLPLYIKEWRPTGWICRNTQKQDSYNNSQVPNSIDIVLHLKSLRISYQSSYLRNSRVLRVCIWFVLWTPLIVYQVFKLKQTSL